MSFAQRLLRVLLLTGLTAVIAGLSYRFFFPGYFHPLAIYHEDHFVYVGMAARGFGLLPYLQQYPRPIAHILLDLCGRLGMYYVLAPVFAASFLNTALVITFLERLFQRSIPLPFIALFIALAYANPRFYLQLKADPFAVFALTFLLLTLHAWHSFADSGNRAFYLGTAGLITLLAFTKESYFAPLAFFLFLSLFIYPRRKLATAGILVYSLAIMAAAIHWNSTKWILLGSKLDRASPYYADLSPASIVHGLYILSSAIFYPALVIALSAILILALWRSLPVLCASLGALAFAILSWLPNATLPNHLELQYSCLGILFVLAPFLLCSYLLPPRPVWSIVAALGGVLIYGLTLLAYSKPFPLDASWAAQQEWKTRNLLPALERMRALSAPLQASLVTGIDGPYNPFRVPDFVEGYLGPARSWTVVVPESAPERASINLRLIHASNPARLQPVARWFRFNMEEHLVHIVDCPSPAQIAPELSAPELAAAVDLAKSSPAMGALSFTASPESIAPNSPPTRATLRWSAPVRHVEVRLGSPTGKLFAAGGPTGEAQSGDWLAPGMQFFLLDADTAQPLAHLQIQSSLPPAGSSP